MHSVFMPENPYFGHNILGLTVYFEEEKDDFSCFNWWICGDEQSITEYFLENIVTTQIKYLSTNFNVIFPYFNKLSKGK